MGWVILLRGNYEKPRHLDLHICVPYFWDNPISCRPESNPCAFQFSFHGDFWGASDSQSSLDFYGSSLTEENTKLMCQVVGILILHSVTYFIQYGLNHAMYGIQWIQAFMRHSIIKVNQIDQPWFQWISLCIDVCNNLLDFIFLFCCILFLRIFTQLLRIFTPLLRFVRWLTSNKIEVSDVFLSENCSVTTTMVTRSK